MVQPAFTRTKYYILPASPPTASSTLAPMTVPPVTTTASTTRPASSLDTGKIDFLSPYPICKQSCRM